MHTCVMAHVCMSLAAVTMYTPHSVHAHLFFECVCCAAPQVFVGMFVACAVTCRVHVDLPLSLFVICFHVCALFCCTCLHACTCWSAHASLAFLLPHMHACAGCSLCRPCTCRRLSPDACMYMCRTCCGCDALRRWTAATSMCIT